MAAYVGVSDLDADMTEFRPDLSLTSSTSPTLVQAGLQRDEMEGEVNAAIKLAGYSQPVSSSDSPLAFNVIVQGLKAGIAAYIYRARGYSPDFGDLTEDVVQLEQKYRDFLTKVMEKPGYLVDATVSTGGYEIPIRKKFASLFSADSDAVDVRTFTRDQKY